MIEENRLRRHPSSASIDSQPYSSAIGACDVTRPIRRRTHYPHYSPLSGVVPLFCQRAPGPRPRHSTWPSALSWRRTRRIMSRLTPGQTASAGILLRRHGIPLHHLPPPSVTAPLPCPGTGSAPAGCWPAPDSCGPGGPRQCYVVHDNHNTIRSLLDIQFNPIGVFFNSSLVSFF